MFSYFFNYKKKKSNKFTYNDDNNKYYKHLKLMKELKKFFYYKNSLYLKALLNNTKYETYYKKSKLDTLYNN